MIAQRQTKRGGPDAPPGYRGNCFGASLASVLEVPISQIPDPPLHLDADVHDSSNWWEHYAEVLAGFGYMLVDFEYKTWWSWMEERGAGILWMAGVPSLNIPPTELVPHPLHSVVMRDTVLAHDPARARRYERVSVDDVVQGHFFLAIDPGVHT